MLMPQYKVKFTYERLGWLLCSFLFVYIYACIAMFLCCCRFLVNKYLYIMKKGRTVVSFSLKCFDCLL